MLFQGRYRVAPSLFRDCQKNKADDIPYLGFILDLARRSGQPKVLSLAAVILSLGLRGSGSYSRQLYLSKASWAITLNFMYVETLCQTQAFSRLYYQAWLVRRSLANHRSCDMYALAYRALSSTAWILVRCIVRSIRERGIRLLFNNFVFLIFSCR